MLRKKNFLVVITLLLLVLIIAGCNIPKPIKGIIKGRVLIPPTAKQLSKDISGWVGAAGAEVTIVDANGVKHTVITDENGYYNFENIAVKANTVVTATAKVDGKTMVLKTVIDKTVGKDQTYDSKSMTPESTALALVVEQLIAEGAPVDLDEIRATGSYADLLGKVTEVLEKQGNIEDDPDVGGLVEDTVYDILYPDDGTPTPPSEGEGGAPTVAVTGVSIDKENMVLTVDDEGDFTKTGQITATIEPSNASNKGVTWESSNEDVATVDSSGNVTAIAIGEATITATSVGNKDKKAECVVTVGEEATWNATGGVGTHTIGETAYIFQEYELKYNGAKVSLHMDEIDSITSNGKELTPNEDSTLWFNVRIASSERVYVVKTKENGTIYLAKLDWEGPQNLDIVKQGDDLIKCGDGVYRYHYKINLAMKKDDTLVYRIKPTGAIDQQVINDDSDDFSIYFRPTDGKFDQIEGDHTYVIKKDSVWYEGAIAYQDKSKFEFEIDENPGVTAVSGLVDGSSITTDAEAGNPGDIPEGALESLAAALENNYNVEDLASRLVKVTLKATEIKDTGYDRVRILPLTVKKDGSDADGKLQAWMYAAVQDKKWFNTVVTGWGSQGTGFKLDSDENSEMDVYIFASELGEYEITFKAVDTSRGVDDTQDEAVICSGEATITVTGVIGS